MKMLFSDNYFRNHFVSEGNSLPSPKATDRSWHPLQSKLLQQSCSLVSARQVHGRPIFVQCRYWEELRSLCEGAKLWTGVWRKTPRTFPDSSSVLLLDRFQSASPLALRKPSELQSHSGPKKRESETRLPLPELRISFRASEPKQRKH